MKPTRRRPPTAVVGAGGLARAFLPRLVAARYPVVAVAARTLRSARRACRGFPQIRPTTRLREAVAGARLVLLAVPDREIRTVASRLAGQPTTSWRGRVVLHHAGALGVEPLLPLARAGAAVGVLHPLQCLGLPGVGTSMLAGSSARIEGAPVAMALARRLARDLGLVPLRLPAHLTPSDRAAYHAAASLAANDLVGLLAIATRLLEDAGLDRASATLALVRLARGALAQVEAGGPEAALTGPVARGDAATLDAQLRRIRQVSRDGAAAHHALSSVLLTLARAAGRLTPAEGRALERILIGNPPSPLSRAGGRKTGTGV